MAASSCSNTFRRFWLRRRAPAGSTPDGRTTRRSESSADLTGMTAMVHRWATPGLDARRGPALLLPDHLPVRTAGVHAQLTRHAQDPLADPVALHLGGARRDGDDLAVQEVHRAITILAARLPRHRARTADLHRQ